MVSLVPKRISTVLVYVVLICAIVITLFPLFWLAMTSLKVPKDYYSSPPVWIPAHLTLSHYVTLFTTYGAGPYIKNSIIIATANTALVLLLAVPSAYAMVRYGIGGRSLQMWILSQRMLPPVAAVIPLFILFSKLHLIDTYPALILTYTIFNLSFAVWMLIGFFRDTPRELYEAAMLDGCTEIGLIVKVLIPVLAQGVAVVALFCFVFAWNELMFALTFTRDRTTTLMVLITSTMQSPTGAFYGEAAGAGLIGLIPPFILTVFFQRYLVRGLSMGAVKG